jgi:type IV fimbrial biogenesis protein FimT
LLEPLMDRHPMRGFTLVELMVTLSVMGILLAVAVPSFGDMLGRRRLEGALNELRIDLQFTRSEALRRNRMVTLAVNAAGTHYTISYPDGSGNTVNAKIVELPTGVTLTGNASVDFYAMRGLASAAVNFVGTSSYTSARLQASNDMMGRVQVCSPSGSFSGYATC